MPSDHETPIQRPSVSRQAVTPTSTTSDTVSCPECGKALPNEPNFCSACGADLRGLSGTSDTLDGPLKERLIDNRYRVLEKLGEGGMGAVYKVEHVRMGKLAALKLLRPDHVLDKGIKARFLQEARVVAKLSHPNTVQVFDSGELDDGGLFIAMEYVGGKDLAWHLKAHGPMSEAQAISVGAQLLASLQEAHEANVIHRDLKPANVMLVRRRKSGEDQVKLVDFGIAKLQEAEGRKSTTGDFVGTPAYMSPEQIRGDTLDARSDLYSLGCLLFELVTGKQPFEGPTPISVLTKHYEAPVPRVSEVRSDGVISHGLQDIIARAMAKRPADRFADADAMRGALLKLQSAMGSKPTELTPMPAERSEKVLSREDFDSFERKLKAQRAAAPVIALAVLAVVAVVGWRWLSTPTVTSVATQEREPNDQVLEATRIAVGSAVTGTIGASTGEGDRDLFVTTATAGPHRVTLSGVADLNLALEVLQLQSVQRDDGSSGEKLTRLLFLDDVGLGDGERVDGVQLAAGDVYLRVEEQAFCTEPNRPSREKSLVPYTLTLEPLPVDGVHEVEPNDTSSTAQALPLTRAVTAWAGLRVDVDALSPLRPDAPFSAADWFRVEGAAEASVFVVVVPPERGSLHVVDGAALESQQKKTLKGALPVLTVKGTPQWLELKAMSDGQRRLRVVSGEEALPGAEYQVAAAVSGDNGLAAVIDLSRALEQRLETRRVLLETARQKFPDAAELHRLNEK